jgi:hypothetical protein
MRSGAPPGRRCRGIGGPTRPRGNCNSKRGPDGSQSIHPRHLPGSRPPPHQGSFKRGHPKHGGRQAGTPNAISAAAAKRLARGAPRTRYRWQRLINKNPLITEAYEQQGQFTRAGAPRRRSRAFKMKSFGQDLSAVAMRAIQTDQFDEQDLVQCLMLSARAIDLRPKTPIPEWTLRFDPKLGSMTPVPVDPRLNHPYHPEYGSPDWKWEFNSRTQRLLPSIKDEPDRPLPPQICDPSGPPALSLASRPGLLKPGARRRRCRGPR